jgi:MFS family permease
VIGIALSPELILTVAFLVMAGFVASTLMSSNTALIQNRIEDNVHGRVMATYMITYGSLPLGTLPMGIVAGMMSTPFSFAASAGLSIALTVLIALKMNGWRGI